MALAIDHRVQLEDVAAKAGADPARIARLQGAGRQGGGARSPTAAPATACCSTRSTAATRCSNSPAISFAWLGRPVELPGSRPLRFEFCQDIGSQLVEWPVDHCIKCLCFYHPDDPAELKAEQSEKLRALFEAARKVGRELLVEIIAGKHGTLDDTTIPRALEELYDARHQARLVEARAAGVGRAPGRRSTR